MRRNVLLGVAFALAGCAGAVEERPPQVPEAAEPQRAELRWRESYPGPGGERLVFVVERFEVTSDGWSANVAITNATTVPYAARTSRPSELRYGLMLFASPDEDEFERANEEGRLPAVRLASEIDPPPPWALAPGATWRTTLSARGSLPAGAYVRLVFGRLRARGRPPEGMERFLTWITDRSHRLRP